MRPAMAASTCVGTPGQSWLMNRGCPAPPVVGDGLMKPLGTCRVHLVPSNRLFLCPRTPQAHGRAQHLGPLIPCPVLFLLAFLHDKPPHLPQSQPLLLPAMPLAVLGKVQCAGSRWTYPQRSTETKSGLSKQLLTHCSAITAPSGWQCSGPPGLRRRKRDLPALHTGRSVPEEKLEDGLPAVPLQQGKVFKHGRQGAAFTILLTGLLLELILPVLSP